MPYKREYLGFQFVDFAKREFMASFSYLKSHWLFYIDLEFIHSMAQGCEKSNRMPNATWNMSGYNVVSLSFPSFLGILRYFPCITRSTCTMHVRMYQGGSLYAHVHNS